MSVLFPAWFARIEPGKDRHTNPDDYCANADQRNLKAILKDERDVFREIRARNGERRPAERVPAARAAGDDRRAPAASWI